MGGAVSAGEDNDELIDNLLEADYVKSTHIELVMRYVDRALYYTQEHRNTAYKDTAWRLGNLHLSAPCIYSEVLECLKLKKGLSFLNLGSGTGYLSTLVGLIIGSYGVNHGVELFQDVVDYAGDCLEEFKQKSPALDAYDFCEPKFVKGNCLALPAGMAQYDRVYCGAACPASYEDYMKNLIKIGGILVMPLNDQLLQITRVSETSWQVKTALPVSFASLIKPARNSKSAVLEKLPEVSFPSLQELVRSSVRDHLRKVVALEHPEFIEWKAGKNVPRTKQQRKARNRRRPLHHIMIPILQGGGGSEDESPGERSQGGHITAVIELARSFSRRERSQPRAQRRGQSARERAKSHDVTTEGETTAESAASTSTNGGIGKEDSNATCSVSSTKVVKHTASTSKCKKGTEDSDNCSGAPRPRRAKFDSGVGDDEDLVAEIGADGPEESGSACGSDGSRKCKGGEEACSADNEEADQAMDTDSDFFDDSSCEMPESRQVAANCSITSAVALSDHDAEISGNTSDDAGPANGSRVDAEHSGCDGDREKSSAKKQKAKEPEKERPKSKAEEARMNFSASMQRKINQLPLPAKLKGFLNYDRQLSNY